MIFSRELVDKREDIRKFYFPSTSQWRWSKLIVLLLFSPWCTVTNFAPKCPRFGLPHISWSINNKKGNKKKWHRWASTWLVVRLHEKERLREKQSEWLPHETISSTIWGDPVDPKSVVKLNPCGPVRRLKFSHLFPHVIDRPHRSIFQPLLASRNSIQQCSHSGSCSKRSYRLNLVGFSACTEDWVLGAQQLTYNLLVTPPVIPSILWRQWCFKTNQLHTSAQVSDSIIGRTLWLLSTVNFWSQADVTWTSQMSQVSEYQKTFCMGPDITFGVRPPDKIQSSK